MSQAIVCLAAAPSVEVTVVMPFDWVTAVAIPVVAILLSSGIAIYLAARERRATSDSRRLDEVTTMSRTLARLIVAARRNDEDTVAQEFVQLGMDATVLRLHLSDPDRVVPEFIIGTLLSAKDNGLATLSTCADWCLDALTSWQLSQLPSDAFKANLPAIANTFHPTIDLRDWKTKSGAPE